MPRRKDPPAVELWCSQGAYLAALEVWNSDVVLSRSKLFQRTAAHAIEQVLSRAVAMGWVQVDGDVVAKGLVDPRPFMTVPDESFRGRRGWGLLSWF